MQIYRVYGDKTNKYYTDVSAASREQAFDIANQRDTIDWLEVETDETIDIYSVEEYN